MSGCQGEDWVSGRVTGGCVVNSEGGGETGESGEGEFVGVVSLAPSVLVEGREVFGDSVQPCGVRVLDHGQWS